MFQTNPNSINNDNEDATRPVVARATHLAKLTTYPDFIDAAADIDIVRHDYPLAGKLFDPWSATYTWI